MYSRQLIQEKGQSGNLIASDSPSPAWFLWTEGEIRFSSAHNTVQVNQSTYTDHKTHRSPGRKTDRPLTAAPILIQLLTKGINCTLGTLSRFVCPPVSVHSLLNSPCDTIMAIPGWTISQLSLHRHDAK